MKKLTDEPISGFAIPICIIFFICSVVYHVSNGLRKRIVKWKDKDE